MQVDIECKGRYYSRSIGGNHRMLRNDAFGSNGFGNSSGQDIVGSAQHRPCLRRNQHGNARTVLANCLWPYAISFLRRRTRRWRISRRPWKGTSQPSRHDVWNYENRNALSRNGRRLLHAHGARRRKPSDRLRICPSWQNDGND